MLTTFTDWTSLIYALKHDYTSSLKDVCKMLKVSRNWANTYIRPHVRHLYLSNNIRNDHSPGINWVRMASFELGKEMSESIWFHTEELYDYILASVSSVTKQTKSVPVTFFMSNAEREKYGKKLKEYDELLSRTTNLVKRSILYQERERCHEKFIYKDSATIELFQNKMNVGKRSLAPATVVNLPDIPISEWMAPHDLKDYGDVDETIYRFFFKTGCIRIELKLSDVNGSIGKKVYYVSDPEPIKGEGPSLIFSEDAWQQYHIDHSPDSSFLRRDSD